MALTPLAREAGLSPWIVALVALKAGNLFLLPYQSPYYLTIYYGPEERGFTHAQARPFAWVYAGLVVVAFVLSRSLLECGGEGTGRQYHHASGTGRAERRNNN